MWFKYGLKAQKLLEAARPERAEAPSPGHRPGLGASALSGRVGLTCETSVVDS